MKFTVMQDLLAEDKTINVSKALELSMLTNRGVIDTIAEKIHNEGFPEKFDLPVKMEGEKEDLTLAFELYEKEVNSEKKSYHVVTFTYEYTRETIVKVRELLKKAEKDESDEEGEAYDTLHEQLNALSELHIMAEFDSKFTKVWGSNK